MINWGPIPIGTVIPFPFAAFGTNGESLTLSGLAVTDIEVYKGTSMTQRASDAGYALMDTDGIDIDTRTGIHGFSIDTGDDTDAGFYAAGAMCWVVLDAVTINSQTVRFVAGTFRLVPAETSAGVPQVRASAIADGAITANTLASDTITAAKIATDAIDADALAADAIAEINATVDTAISDAALATAANLATVDTVVDAIKVTTDKLDDTLEDDAGTFRFTENALEQAPAGGGGGDATEAKQDIIIAALAVVDGNVDSILVDTGTTLDGKIDTIDNLIDTEVAAIKTVVDAIQAKTDNLPSDPADASVVAGLIGGVDAKIDTIDANVDSILVDTAEIGAAGAGLTVLATQASVNTIDDFLDTEVAAIKAKTDSLTFTVAGVLDANVQRINDVAITGDGQPGTEFGV